MPNTAAYARYSSEEQRPTSIEDQHRRCLDVAAREGLTIEPRLFFADEAVTGKAEGKSRRAQYLRLLDAIEARECDVVVADEVSRLTRHFLESARLIDLVERTGLRVITADGLDTSREGWKAMWGLKALLASSEVDSTSLRVKRGLQGQLKRGFQIAPPPYGYRAVKQLGADGQPVGTIWQIEPVTAAVVRRIYRMRHSGMSMVAIATQLQSEGVRPPGRRRKNAAAYWRPASVHRLIRNPIYMGTFVLHGSYPYQVQARKRREIVETESFERPQCALVDEDTWRECNAPRRGQTSERAPAGGGRHLFSGLIRCGDCAALVSLRGSPTTPVMCCPGCMTAHRIGARERWIGYSSVSAASQALLWALHELFRGPVREAFRRHMRARLTDASRDDERQIRQEIDAQSARLARLKSLAADPELDPEVFLPELKAASGLLSTAKKRLEAVRRRTSRVTPETIEAQLAVDPYELLRHRISCPDDVYKLRATLKRLLARFELVARPRKGHSVFVIGFAPGVYLAEQSDTEVIDATRWTFEVSVRTSARRPLVWETHGRRIDADATPPSDSAS